MSDSNVYSSMMEELAEFSDLTGALKKEKTPVMVTGVSDSVRAHLIFCVCNTLNSGGLVVAHDETAARQIYEDLRFFAPRGVLFYPGTDLLFYDVEARGRDVTKRRLEVLEALAMAPGPHVVVTTPEALCSITVPREIYEDQVLCLKVGDDIPMDELASRLTALGYKREDMVEGSGQFSIRGGIADIFPGELDTPLRIEFFDTEVDSIRYFDPETQRTVERAEEARILPAAELLPGEEQRQTLVQQLEKAAAELSVKSHSEDREQKLAAVLKRDAERLKEGMRFPSMDKYIPQLFGDHLPTLLDYIPRGTIAFWEEPARLEENARKWEEDFHQQLCELAERGVLQQAGGNYALPFSAAMKRMAAMRPVALSPLAHSSGELRPAQTIALTVKSLNGFQGKLEFLVEALEHYRKNMYHTLILAGAAVRGQHLARQLQEEGIPCVYQETVKELPPAGTVVLTAGSVNRGFEYPLIRTVMIGDREIFGGGKQKRRRPRYHGKKGDQISSFTDLNPGDFVVHQNHGIGKYLGIEQLTVDGISKDYLKIQYRDSDMLYVPTDQLDMVYKHTARDGAHVRVNKLGGADWNRTKQRVKAAAADMAKDLIALYAQRSHMPGIAFSPDGEWQRDFEAAFPYEETDDQLRSIEEVKRDMERPHPMDRLLCGDVGYGKTEVALRAAFKAVTDGYQVAYLVPTTILANQHYNTFKQRMRDFPVNVAMLSRFCTPAQQKEIVEGIATGEIDVVIGTHKLLGKTIRFHKLGLLIVDEEQRFGVGHKEKLKEIRKEVDVLTLSATPIPRTLHMSLSGIRDMSVINQPPGDRYPVATYVLEYDENVVKDAISRELARGGQVYYLFNRVEGIFQAATRLAELAPEARVAVAHGRMHESELEAIMMDVAEGEVDVLVCTTIIETGLDIANVNTMIIEDADRLGLAQLYQLRGRVGRSNRLAYAYLTFRRNKMLSEDAEKRLLAIKEFTEFGSGFKIAMRDLEIRGTGNLIGAQQHGHMEAVGYEMYCRLLEEAVREQKGDAVEKQTETMIDLPVSAYIPESYIRNHSQRIGAYKRIAAIDSQEELYDVYDEIEDRYGTVPQVVSNLMEVALIKSYARRYGVAELIGSPDQVNLRFDPENIPDLQPCVDLIMKEPKIFWIQEKPRPTLHYKLAKPVQPQQEGNYLKALRELLEGLIA